MDIHWSQLQVAKWMEEARMETKRRRPRGFWKLGYRIWLSLSESLACLLVYLFAYLYLCLHVNSICKYNFSSVINFQRRIHQAINQIKCHLSLILSRSLRASQWSILNVWTNEANNILKFVIIYWVQHATQSKAARTPKQPMPLTQYLVRIDTVSNLYRNEQWFSSSSSSLDSTGRKKATTEPRKNEVYSFLRTFYIDVGDWAPKLYFNQIISILSPFR